MSSRNIKRLERDLKKLIDRNGDLKKDIEKAKDTIRKAEAEIEENIIDQEKKRVEIDAQKGIATRYSKNIATQHSAQNSRAGCRPWIALTSRKFYIEISSSNMCKLATKLHKQVVLTIQKIKTTPPPKKMVLKFSDGQSTCDNPSKGRLQRDPQKKSSRSWGHPTYSENN